MKCANCGSEMPDNVKFCRKCGNPMQVKCPNCGNLLPRGSAFCTNCGAKIDDAKSGMPPAQGPVQKAKKKSKTPVIVLIAVLAAIALMGGAFVGYKALSGSWTGEAAASKNGEDWPDKGKDSKKDSDKKEKQAEETTTAEEKITEETTTAGAYETTVAATAAATTAAADTTAAGWDNSYYDNTYYILPGSDSRYLTISDLDGMTKDSLRLARNEIYARHGRRFQSEDLQNYFNGLPWYFGTIDPDKFDESVLNDYEKKNLELIKEAEALFK